MNVSDCKRIVFGLGLIVLAAAGWAAGTPGDTAREILAATGVKGGFVVHLGCGDGALTAALRVNDSYQVQGLDTAPANVEKARARVQSLNLYGPVCVDRWNGERLPYIDNMVNLIVAEDPAKATPAELLRVLAPRGVAYVKNGGAWTKTVKPVPPEIDEWTHYMHDATGNAVADDTAIGPPERLQWVGGPRWSRHHEHMSSVSAVVSAGGRVFTIFDEGSRAAIQLPPKWKLIARDAFNGTVLWKRDIPLWYTHLLPLKSGPALLPRRLVAVGDVVYVTLGLDRPVEALDAATGKTLRTYTDTKATEEILVSNGVLFALANREPLVPDHYTWNDPVCWNEKNRVATERPWDQKPRTLLAFEAATGKTLWSKEVVAAPLTLAVDERRVAFHDGEKIVCLDRASGQPKWSSGTVSVRSPIPVFFAPTLVLNDGLALFAGGTGEMGGYDGETGKELWTGKHYRAGHASPEDLLVVGGMAWTGELAGAGTNIWTGTNIRTGKVEKEFKPDIESYWFHNRCHRAKATVNFLMPSRTGIEFVDWRAQTWDRNHWVRGACVYGVMPCNGLVYAPQNPCACYLESKLFGFSALLPAAKEPLQKPAEEARLEKGPAYDELISNTRSGVPPSGGIPPEGGTPKLNPADWPTYRHDNTRSGAVAMELPAKLEPAWQARLGGRLSAVVAAGGKCFVSSIDTHTIHALDAASGTPAWTFTAGGRIDSPPTICGDRLYFGCADGWVYCLRAADGALAWRYLAAPADRRQMAFEQLESVWPVSGAVLVREGVVHAVAGRSAFLDGGMRFCRIDARTGKLVSETIIDDKVPETGQDLQTVMNGLNLPPALPDVLSSDDKFIYMRSQRFDLAGKRTEVVSATDPTDQLGEGRHLFSSIGFLDDTWFHRAYQLYGREVTSGCNYWFMAGKYAPSGRIMVFNDKSIFSYDRLPQYYVWSPALEYRLYGADKDVKPEAIQRVFEATKHYVPEQPAPAAPAGKAGKGKKKKAKAASNTQWIFNREVTGRQPREDLTAVDAKWSVEKPPLLARAMVLAGQTLFLAGPPDVLDEESAVARHFDEDIQKKLDEQDAALEGKRGALMWAVSTADGKVIGKYDLDSPPVWDGMAAAGGRLFVGTMDGKVVCFK